MPLHRLLLPEREPTKVADIRPRPRVNEFMLLQILRLGERFPTVLADVADAFMDGFYVSNETWLLIEALSTVFADVGLFWVGVSISSGVRVGAEHMPLM